MAMTDIDKIKMEVRENQSPYFTNDDIEYYLSKYGNDIDRTIYELLIIKSEDSNISVSGLSTKDTSSYFKRLASKYKKYNTGVLSND